MAPRPGAISFKLRKVTFCDRRHSAALAIATLLSLPAAAAVPRILVTMQAVPRSRVTPTAIPTVAQSGAHIANMLAVVAADLAADNEPGALDIGKYAR
jgi:hypothetical protein